MAAVPGPTPAEILALDGDGADQLLDELERSVPRHPPFLAVPSGEANEAVLFGDTHGDWRSTLEVVGRFLAGANPRLLIGLGDYVDRCPPDCPEGSVANAIFLLSLAARLPARVLLLQGNHETSRRVPAIPHTLRQEVDRLWGRADVQYPRLLALLERGPIAAVTSNGAYLAHAGFPRELVAPDWRASFDPGDEQRLCEVVWAECDAARSRRGAAAVWGAPDLDRFLAATGSKILFRGHDPDLCGRPLYGGRCLTLQTTRVYERFGGVIAATLPLRAPLDSVASATVHHLPTEGRTFPRVGR